MTPKDFLKHITATEGCVVWTGGVAKNGYGMVHINSHTYSAHKAAYMLTKGDVPKGMDVCHSCDNRLCINPDHLFLGNRQTNMLDALQKGNLTQLFYEGEAWLMRHLYFGGISMRTIARMFLTNHKMVGKILRNPNYPTRSLP